MWSKIACHGGQSPGKKLESIQTNFPALQLSIPEVFILESLDESDEKEGRYEGRLLYDMLVLAGKKPKYFYFQSKEELPHLIALFRLSNYRYLHISCHADDHTVATTADSLTYQEFAGLLKKSLKLRRLFMSACEVGNENFSTTIAAENKGMHSIVAPCSAIRFDHAAAVWSAFYVSMFTSDHEKMKSKEIEKTFRLLKELFPVDFFLSLYSPKKDAWRFETT